ncbi:MAG: hypothetical protein WAM30_09080, partial [Candidatus Dormiibacterota bacterium]
SGVTDAPAELPGLPASVLARFWPDKLTPGGTARPVAPTVIPCRGITTGREALANHILALALWSLHDQRLVRLEVQTSRFQFLVKANLTVAVCGAAELDGIEGELLTAAAGSSDVAEVVRLWLGADFADPWQHVIDRADRAALGLGLYTRLGGAAARLDQPLQARCDRISVSGLDADRLAVQWRHFQSEEWDLWGRLVFAVAGACRSRKLP